MLREAPAFSSFSINDMDNTREFYSGILGLKVEDDEMGLLNVRLSAGNTIMMYPKPDHVPATFTVLNFIVPDIDQVVDELISKGIEFEQYDSDDLKTDEKGISRSNGMSMAWFTDPSGNILSVLEAKH